MAQDTERIQNMDLHELVNENCRNWLLETYSKLPQFFVDGFEADQPITQQLVHCRCGIEYLVNVNGHHSISDYKMLGVECPYCSIPAGNALTVSGHSGDVFNATAGLPPQEEEWVVTGV